MSAPARRSSASPATRSTTRRSSSPTRSRRCTRAGIDYSQMAVFYRTNSQTRALEEIFIRSALPYKIMGGTKFYERAEIKDALAYLIAVVEPRRRDGAAPHHQQPRRGIGDGDRDRSRGYADDNRSPSATRSRRRRSASGPRSRRRSPTSTRCSPRRRAHARPANPAGASPVAEGLQLLLGKSGYTDALRASRDPQDEARVENLDELVAVAREFARNNPEGTVVDFLAEVALVSDADDLEDAAGSVSLMTMHTAKGLEYDAVFVTGVEEDLHPAPHLGGRARRTAGGAAPVLRRHHARPQAALPLARDDPRAVRRDVGRDAEPVPAGDPGRADPLAAVARRRRTPAAARSRARSTRAARAGSGSGDRRLGGSGSGGSGPLERQHVVERLREQVEDGVAEPHPGKVRDNGDLELAPGTASVTTTSARAEWMP